MTSWLWLLLPACLLAFVVCLLVFVTIQAIRAIRKGTSPWRAVREWLVNVWDILSGLG